MYLSYKEISGENGEDLKAIFNNNIFVEQFIWTILILLDICVSKHNLILDDSL